MIRLAGGDFGLAEEAVQDAFALARMQWPSEGTPSNPRAWLLRAAQNKAIDRLRRRSRFEARRDEDAAPEALSIDPLAQPLAEPAN